MEPKTVLEADYLDIIFDKRNKLYGGYELRRHYNQRLVKAACFMLLAIAVLACFSFVNSNHADRIRPNTTVVTPTIIDMASHPILSPKVVRETPPPRHVNTKLFTIPVIEATDHVPDDKLLTQNKNPANANPGSSTNNGDSTGIGTAPGNNIGTGTSTVVSKTSKPVVWVEQMPQFAGDLNAYIGSHIRYPDMARESNIEGTVMVKFVVNEDGAVSDAIVVRGPGGGCDEEALRMVNSMPKWKPGKQNGMAVKVFFTLPIKFVLN